MFFSLERKSNPDFPNHYSLGELVFNTDNGWCQTTIDGKTFVYKGYLETTTWSPEVLRDIADYQYSGNFLVCCFDPATGNTDLYTNQWRGFLIWADTGTRISNLYHGSHTIWNDSTVSIDQDLIVGEVKADIIGNTDLPTSDKKSVEEGIDAILHTRVGNFIKNCDLPLRVFCSGGVDSTLVWSYVAQHTQNFELVLEDRVQWDYFWCRNRRKIKDNFWAYKQIHHWLNPCVLTSGTPGDEFMLRSPTIANLWCMYHGIDIFDWLSEAPSMMRDYLKKNSHIFQQQQQDRSLDSILKSSRQKFIAYLCNIVLNDCQHWHLGNTLTFTPLRDLNIFKLMLSLPLDEFKNQLMNSDVSQRLIARNDANLLSVLSDKKNISESLTNLTYNVPR